MAFFGYNCDSGECHLSPYSNTLYYDNFEAFPAQSSVSYSSYEYTVPGLIEYSPVHNHYYTLSTQPELSYSVYNITEPKLVQYNTDHSSVETKYTIYYSTTNLDDTLFEEYDPTPYGGGYDIAQTYGKPLLPSDEICYPRSSPEATGAGAGAGAGNCKLQLPIGVSIDDFSYGTTPSTYTKHDDQDQPGKTQIAIKEIDAKIEQQPVSGPGDTDKVVKDHGIVEDPINVDQEDEESEHGIGRIGEYGYDCGTQVTQRPYGAGLEAVDLCESLFGYWPCLAKEKQNRNRNGNCVSCDEGSNNNNQWNSTADYLFGNPFGDFDYNYYYYHEEQPQFLKDW